MATSKPGEESSSSSEALLSYRSSADKIFDIWGVPETQREYSESPKQKKAKLVHHGGCHATDAGALDFIELSKKKPDEINDEEPTQAEDEDDSEYMKMATMEAEKSPDPQVKVGAVIANRDTKAILGRGYNRMPKGCEKLPWSDNIEREPLDSKYPYVFHGVKAAITDAINNQKDMKGATVYTTLFPANTDAQWIADLEIKEVVYRDNTYRESRFAKAARRIYKEGGIKLRKMAQGD